MLYFWSSLKNIGRSIVLHHFASWEQYLFNKLFTASIDFWKFLIYIEVALGRPNCAAEGCHCMQFYLHPCQVFGIFQQRIIKYRPSKNKTPIKGVNDVHISGLKVSVFIKDKILFPFAANSTTQESSLIGHFNHFCCSKYSTVIMKENQCCISLYVAKSHLWATHPDKMQSKCDRAYWRAKGMIIENYCEEKSEKMIMLFCQLPHSAALWSFRHLP